MSKIWFCRTCGYEVSGRGRCHACRQRLELSPLPELAAGDEDDEVGYRLEGWTTTARGDLIVGLLDGGIVHRFEDEELVVAADDEERTDDLIASVTAGAGVEEEDAAEDAAGSGAEEDVPLLVDVELLYQAARRLRTDPTDMQADGDVAQASAVVFAADRFTRADHDTWAAVGRVTRRLLGALGAEEALEEEITVQAGVLVKLLEPLVGDDAGDPRPYASPGVFAAMDPVQRGEEGGGEDRRNGASGATAVPAAAAGGTSAAEEPAAGDEDSAGDEDVAGGDPGDDTGEDPDGGEDLDDGAGEDGESGDDESGEDGGGGERHDDVSVYELPEWLPEQRAQLSLLLDEAAVAHSWEGGDLVVPAALEAEVEALFDRVEGVSADEDDEARYRTLEALFEAADRFVNDPDSGAKAAEVVKAVAAADGPTPLGLDDAQWWSIRTRARTLADSIEHGANLEVVFSEATTLRDLLRALV